MLGGGAWIGAGRGGGPEAWAPQAVVHTVLGFYFEKTNVTKVALRGLGNLGLGFRAQGTPVRNGRFVFG